MRVSIFGLGYVGAVSAACFARDGHDVICVDVNHDKVALIASGKSPIVEPGLSELLSAGVSSGQIRATVDPCEAVVRTDVSLVSVGTPKLENGAPDLNYVFKVCKEISEAVKEKKCQHIVVIRSTVAPGTLKSCWEFFIDNNNEKVHLAFNPEFLREGSAIRDYYEPPYTIIGTDDPLAEVAVRDLYRKVAAPVVVVKPEVAEMCKRSNGFNC